VDIYRDSGDAAETLASVDMMWEKYRQEEEGIFIQNLDFEEYNGAVIYAARTPLDGADPYAARHKHNFEVLRRNTGGSPVVLRPNDVVITASRPNKQEELLKDYIWPVIEDSLDKYGVDGEYEIKNGNNRRSIWVDGKPISSFSSREKEPGFLSGVIFVEPFEVDRVSDIINLRPGEKEYISQMPTVSENSKNRGNLSEIILEKLEGSTKSLANFSEELEGRAESYRGEIFDTNGSKYRGFCPVYEEDLVEFRNSHLENHQ